MSTNITYDNNEIWFVTGAQLLYGGDAVKHVDAHSTAMVDAMNKGGRLPYKIIYKGTVNSAPEIEEQFRNANNDPQCAGVITWMHTFSPAKMWIRGLKALQKPLLHLHTQFHREIPWSDIDMDYMNLNQSAHGDREFGHIMARLKKPRKVVVGFWDDEDVQQRIAVWMRVCAACADARQLRVLRFGDNMNNVAVTDGDKVEAEIVFDYHVDYCPVGDLTAVVDNVTENQIDELVAIYETQYDFAPNAAKSGTAHKQVREAARIEIGLRKLLEDAGAKAFTTNFDALHGLNQLPGLASQRLMADGYGFGAEGDWKTAALVRTMKVMTHALPGGTSFMEDYVYHFKNKGAILQAHMLEVCPTICAQKPRMEVHPLGIGGKADPARLVFTAHPGRGVAVTVVDMGNRFRMILNEVQCVAPEQDLPKLPVARGFWIPQPDLKTAAAAWIYAGGTHHTSFSYDLTSEYFEDYTDITGVELLKINDDTTIESFKNDLKINEMYSLLR